ncbi:MAG: hypothetical protein MJ252_20290 [archaeon]|nr:hypothetical protein [archaeon]
MASKEEEEMLNQLNAFREDPTCITNTLNAFITGIKRLNPNLDTEKYERFKYSLETTPPTQPLVLNEDLCKVAKEMLNKYTSEDNFVLSGDKCEEYFPKDSLFPTEGATIAVTDLDRPDLTLIKLSCSDEDTDQMQKNNLISDEVTHCGISVKLEDEDEQIYALCLVLAKGPREKPYELSDKEKDIIKAINDFRKDPTSISPTLEKYSEAMQKLSPDSAAIEKYDEFKKSLEDIQPVKPIKVNDELCKAAKDFLENNPIEDDIVYGGDVCQNYLPKDKGFPTDEAAIVSTETDYPDLAVIKLNCNDFDDNNIIRDALKSDDISQAGISIKDKEGEDGDQTSQMCLILTKDQNEEKQEKPYVKKMVEMPKKEKPRKEPKGFDRPDTEEEKEFVKEHADGLGELWKAFKILDIDDNEQLRIKEIVEEMEFKGNDKSHPVLYRMMNELNDGRKYVTWPQFAKHFWDSLGDKETMHGKRDIYEVFKPCSSFKELNYPELKDINDYLELGYTEEQIQDMIENNTRNKHGITFEDYNDRLKEIKNKEETE